MVRAASGQAGMTSASAPLIVTAMRPRLKAIWSSNGSRAASSSATRLASGSKRAPIDRDPSDVHTNRPVAAIAELRASVTRRVAFEHSIAKRTIPVESMKRAALPLGTV